MALIDRESFEQAKKKAAAEWRARGDGETAEMFAALLHEKCGFGMQSGMRVCWATIEGRKIGLFFALEDCAYLRSFMYRPAGGGAPGSPSAKP